MSNQHEITKYPNRRFYDVTLSRHVTLSELHQLVVAGHEIVVKDKTTGRDITNVVLTQIILEHDPPKMELFPSSLLHQVIQMNENVVRRFIDQYLAQAMNAFSQSRQQFDAFLNRAGIPANLPTAPMDWFRMFMPGVTPNQGTSPPQHTSAASDSEGAVAEESNEHETPPTGASAARDDDIAALRQQVAAMSKQLARIQPSRTSASKPTKKKPKKKTARTRKSK